PTRPMPGYRCTCLRPAGSISTQPTTCLWARGTSPSAGAVITVMSRHSEGCCSAASATGCLSASASCRSTAVHNAAHPLARFAGDPHWRSCSKRALSSDPKFVSTCSLWLPCTYIDVVITIGDDKNVHQEEGVAGNMEGFRLDALYGPARFLHLSLMESWPVVSANRQGGTFENRTTMSVVTTPVRITFVGA